MDDAGGVTVALARGKAVAGGLRAEWLHRMFEDITELDCDVGGGYGHLA
jgi:hypothetical protein